MRIFCPAMVASVSFSRCRYVRKRCSHMPAGPLILRCPTPAVGRVAPASTRQHVIKQLDNGDLEVRGGQKLAAQKTHPDTRRGWLAPGLRRNRKATNHPARTQPD